MRLIINADDLGQSPRSNDAVADLLVRGLITSATVMANAPYLEDGIQKIPTALRPCLGVHLNITEFRPLTEHPGWDGWLDEEGRFSLPGFREKRLTIRVKEAILAEWCAQVDRVRGLGLEVSHLDSHHDVHTDPRLLVVLKRLQWRTGLRKIRLAETLGARPKRFFWKKRLWNWAVRLCPPPAVTTHAFGQFSTFLEMGRKRPLTHPTLEVMVHPGHPGYDQETAVLSSPWREALTFPVELISYCDL